MRKKSYLPTDHEVRRSYVTAQMAEAKQRGRYEPGDEEMYAAEFDAWLGQAMGPARGHR